MGPHLSITTLNVNGLNTPIKRQRLVEWINTKQNKENPIYVVSKRPTSKEETHTN